MNVYLEISSGSLKGIVFKLSPKLRFGSGACEISIKDDRTIPDFHSQVMLNHQNQMVLVCTNSTYEIIVSGQSVKKALLAHNSTLRIGRTDFKVVITEHPIPRAIDPMPAKVQEVIEKKFVEAREEAFNFQSKPNNLDSEKNLLIGHLKKTLESYSGLSVPANANFKLFSLPIRLRVETGPQADDEFVFGWGPREFGPLALEFPIEYPPFPGILFTLTPQDDDRVLFSTKFPEFARVSGQNQNPCVIDSGDRLIVGNSTILVEFMREF